MVVAVLEFEVHMPECQSLKDKRRVVQSLFTKIRNRYNVSIREIDHLDRRQRATVGVAKVLAEPREAEQLAAGVERQIVGYPALEVLRREIQFLESE